MKAELELDNDLVAALTTTNQPVRQAAKEMIVLELYRPRIVSSGKAAEMLGMARFEFVAHASRLGIPFYEMTTDELAAEIEMASRACKPR